MNIQLKDGTTKGSAFISDGQEIKAEMTYSKAGSRLIIIDHTAVNSELRGQNIGRQLLDKIVGYARANELKILPLCPFAKSVFEKDMTINDVLQTNMQKEEQQSAAKKQNTKEYSNGEITIVWEPKKCTHAGVCVKKLPKVYHPKEKPWIKIENANTKALKEQIHQCPSGALSFRTNKV